MPKGPAYDLCPTQWSLAVPVKPSLDKPRSYSGDMMELGRQAERIAVAYLKGCPTVKEVRDLRQNRELRPADIDYMVTMRDGRVYFVEIKYNSYLGVGPYYFYEAYRLKHSGHPDNFGLLGCLQRSRATYIIHYAPSVHKLYVCRRERLLKVVQKYTNHARRTSGRIPWKEVHTDSVTTTMGILIPMEWCERIFFKYDLSDDLRP